MLARDLLTYKSDTVLLLPKELRKKYRAVLAKASIANDPHPAFFFFESLVTWLATLSSVALGRIDPDARPLHEARKIAVERLAFGTSMATLRATTNALSSRNNDTFKLNTEEDAKLLRQLINLLSSLARKQATTNSTVENNIRSIGHLCKEMNESLDGLKLYAIPPDKLELYATSRVQQPGQESVFGLFNLVISIRNDYSHKTSRPWWPAAEDQLNRYVTRWLHASIMSLLNDPSLYSLITSYELVPSHWSQLRDVPDDWAELAARPSVVARQGEEQAAVFGSQHFILYRKGAPQLQCLHARPDLVVAGIDHNERARIEIETSAAHQAAVDYFGARTLPATGIDNACPENFRSDVLPSDEKGTHVKTKWGSAYSLALKSLLELEEFLASWINAQHQQTESTTTATQDDFAQALVEWCSRFQKTIASQSNESMAVSLRKAYDALGNATELPKDGDVLLDAFEKWREFSLEKRASTLRESDSIVVTRQDITDSLTLSGPLVSQLTSYMLERRELFPYGDDFVVPPMTAENKSAFDVLGHLKQNLAARADKELNRQVWMLVFALMQASKVRPDQFDPTKEISQMFFPSPNVTPAPQFKSVAMADNPIDYTLAQSIGSSIRQNDSEAEDLLSCRFAAVYEKDSADGADYLIVAGKYMGDFIADALFALESRKLLKHEHFPIVIGRVSVLAAASPRNLAGTDFRLEATVALESIGLVYIEKNWGKEAGMAAVNRLMEKFGYMRVPKHDSIEDIIGLLSGDDEKDESPIQAESEQAKQGKVKLELHVPAIGAAPPARITGSSVADFYTNILMHLDRWEVPLPRLEDGRVAFRTGYVRYLFNEKPVNQKGGSFFSPFKIELPNSGTIFLEAHASIESAITYSKKLIAAVTSPTTQS